MDDYPDIDGLIERIRAEAQRPEYQVEEPQSLHPLPQAPRTSGGGSENAPAPTSQAAAAPAPAPAVAMTLPVTADDFLLLGDDDQCIELAYQRLLGRPADALGAQYYRDLLQRGYGRLFVLCALRAAREAGGYRGEVAGLGLAPLTYNLWRVLRRVGLESAAATINRAYGLRRQLQALARSGIVQRTTVALESQRVSLEETRRQATSMAQNLTSADDRIGSLQEQIASVSTSAITMGEAIHSLRGEHAAQADAVHELRLAMQGSGALTDAELGERIDRYYAAFEAECRGSEANIRAAQQGYLDSLATLPGSLRELPVIDIGCGRGEWLRLLHDAGIPALGFDLSPVFADHCRQQGLDVQQGDAVALLATRDDASAAAISAFHIVEHLPFPLLFRLLEEAARVLAPGGVLLLETPNPENVLVGSHTFYHDFSHRNPVTPTALEFLVGYFGFTDIELRRLHPYGETAYIGEDTLAAQRVNGHLYGPQDFALLARRPGGPPAALPVEASAAADIAAPAGPATQADQAEYDEANDATAAPQDEGDAAADIAAPAGPATQASAAEYDEANDATAAPQHEGDAAADIAAPAGPATQADQADYDEANDATAAPQHEGDPAADIAAPAGPATQADQAEYDEANDATIAPQDEGDAAADIAADRSDRPREPVPDDDAGRTTPLPGEEPALDEPPAPDAEPDAQDDPPCR